jgi:hypothetical protein
MDSHTAPTVDVSAFRKAMGSFPTGVTVVTVAHGDGDMHGVTVNSFSSVSLVAFEPGITGCPVLLGAAASLRPRPGRTALVAFPAVVGERDHRGPSARRYPCH